MGEWTSTGFKGNSAFQLRVVKIIRWYRSPQSCKGFSIPYSSQCYGNTMHPTRILFLSLVLRQKRQLFFALLLHHKGNHPTWTSFWGWAFSSFTIDLSLCFLPPTLKSCGRFLYKIEKQRKDEASKQLLYHVQSLAVRFSKHQDQFSHLKDLEHLLRSLMPKQPLLYCTKTRSEICNFRMHFHHLPASFICVVAKFKYRFWSPQKRYLKSKLSTEQFEARNLSIRMTFHKNQTVIFVELICTFKLSVFLKDKFVWKEVREKEETNW